MLLAGAAWRSVGLLLAVVLPVRTAQADPVSRRPPAAPMESWREARTFMGAMRVESRRDAERIRHLYASSSPPFADRAAVADALTRGGLARLPADVWRFNIAPRLAGDSPLGEMDLAFQSLYLSAHPAALGCLIHVASRVRRASLDVTSLVRHVQYQHALRRTNVNASASLSTHTIGMAFDISMLNQSLPAMQEIRDVLRRMRDDGDLLFIAEQRQLVFHIVPHPDRLPFYEAVFRGMTAAPMPRFAPSLPDAPSPPRPAAMPLFTSAVMATEPWWMSVGVMGLAVASLLRPRRRRFSGARRTAGPETALDRR